jgi:dTDP-4-amino-4,6-dideoxygalactose transaminase
MHGLMCAGALGINAPITVLHNGEKLETSLGRLIYNEALPPELGFVNKQLNKKELAKIVGKIIKLIGIERTPQYLDAMKDTGFKYVTTAGITWSIADLQMPKEKAGILEIAEQQVAEIREQYMNGFLTDNERRARVIKVWTEVKSQIAKLVPVALDCSIDHLNVTSAELAKKIDDLKAVFLTNALGFCGDIDAIRDLCAKKNVILLEDNCESLGTIYKGELLGNFSLASTFSFFVGHHLSTIEGGMICTDDEELYHMLLMVRAHGWDRPLPKDKQQALRKEHGVDEFHATYTFYESAYNIRATEISGMLGVLQLPMLPKTIDRREQNFKKFQKAVESCADRYHTLAVDHIERISNFAMPVITKSKKIFEETVERFQKAGVEIRPVIAGDVTVHPFWTKTLPKADCPKCNPWRKTHSNKK